VQAAIAAIIGDLPGIGKDQQMGTGQFGYAYRGIEQITQHVQPLLAKYGVVIVPRAKLVTITPAHDAKPGWQDTVLAVDWLIVGPDASTMEASTIGVGRDNSDKGANKAMSQAFKYLLLQLLCISDAKDDADGHENRSMIEDRTPDPNDPVVVLFEMVKAVKGTDREDPLRELAASAGKTLSPKTKSGRPSSTHT
jgi:hypothetical protein